MAIRTIEGLNMWELILIIIIADLLLTLAYYFYHRKGRT